MKELLHARILLKAHAAPDSPSWYDSRIAEADEATVVLEQLLPDSDAAVAPASIRFQFYPATSPAIRPPARA